MEIVELPQVDREARYDFYRRAYKDSAHGVGMADAEGMSQQMDEWVRALVAIIESGGGAGGGKA